MPLIPTEAAAEFHAAWCSCNRCNHIELGSKPELRALACGAIAGLVVIGLLFAGLL